MPEINKEDDIVDNLLFDITGKEGPVEKETLQQTITIQALPAELKDAAFLPVNTIADIALRQDLDMVISQIPEWFTALTVTRDAVCEADVVTGELARNITYDKEALDEGLDVAIHDRLDQTRQIYPAKVILVEGILIFASPELCDEMDIKLFVDADADVRILRRIVRDVRDRGRSLDSVVNQYLTTVKPMHEQFVEPSKRRADIIIPEGGHNLVALDMIMERVRAHLEQ